MESSSLVCSRTKQPPPHCGCLLETLLQTSLETLLQTLLETLLETLLQTLPGASLRERPGLCRGPQW